MENIDEDNNDKTNENIINIVIEDIDGNENENENEEINKEKDKKGKKKKNKEIIEVDEDDEQIKDEDNYKEENICKIKIDSSSDNQPNLIKMNEKIYNKKMTGKKRSKK